MIYRREELAKINYIKKASSNNYWFDFYYDKAKNYINKFDELFNLIIIGDENIENDYYIIPFSYLSDIFIEKNLSSDTKTQRTRWVGNIFNKRTFKLNNCDITFDVSQFYGNPDLLSENSTNDYEEITNKALVKIRKKQNLFRQKVLNNFNNKCCLTGIKENELIIASHIIPWSERVDTRLDPSNGLCLSVLYDKLFDKGFISFDNDYKVLVPTNVDALSNQLKKILLEIKGKQISFPKSYEINQEYLYFHRKNIFKG